MSMGDSHTFVLVYGTGSIGAILSYLLSKSIPQQNIYAVCRSNYAAAAENGFTIDSSLWGADLVVRPTVVRSVQEAVDRRGDGHFQYVLVTTKATPECLEGEAIRPAVSPETAIVILQNGIAIEEPFHDKFPESPIISGVLYTPVTQTSPTSFTHGYLDNILLGSFPAKAPSRHKDATEKLARMLASAGATAKHIDDVQIERWKKLIINGPLNPVCALVRLRDATFFTTSDGTVPFVKDIMEEIAATARAAGYACIDDEVVATQLNMVATRALPGVLPSMMADALGGRQMEIGALLGNTVKIAQRHGVATPLLKALLVLTTALNTSVTGN